MSLRLSRCRIVVTGGSGFLGSALVDELARRGAADVRVPRSRDYDLTDARAARALFEDLRPDLVLHLAAKVGGIEANRRSPGTFFRDNLAMGLHVLEEARRAGTTKVLVTGTICSYPEHTPVPFREDDLWNGYPEPTNAPYGIAKKALLVMAQAYRQEFGTNIVFVMPVNLYGPGDHFDLENSHVVPAMVRKLVEARLAGTRLVDMWGDGSPTREFLYVADAARGLVDAAERYDGKEPVNLGTGLELSIRDLAARVALAAGYDGELRWDETRPNGQPRRRVDVSRARESFGFVATTSFDDGLARTVDWYCKHRGEILSGEAVR